MSILKMALKKNIKVKDITKFKNPLFIGPHPDDIEFGCGGTVKKMVQSGANVHFLIATDGAAGTLDKDVTIEMLKDIRRKESINSANYLGVKTIDFMDLEDGGPFTEVDAIKEICKYVLKYKPDIIFSVDASLYTECHYDHIRIGKAVRYSMNIFNHPTALRRFGVDITGIDEFPSNVYLALYFSDKNNTFVRINKEQSKAKFEALKLHESQMDSSTDLLFKYFNIQAIENGLKHFKGKSEGFQILHPLMQHVYSLGI